MSRVFIVTEPSYEWQDILSVHATRDGANAERDRLHNYAVEHGWHDTGYDVLPHEDSDDAGDPLGFEVQP